MATETISYEPPTHKTIVLGASGIMTEVIVQGGDTVTITPDAEAFMLYGEEAVGVDDEADGAALATVPLTASFAKELSIRGNHLGSRATWRCLIGSLTAACEVLIEVEKKV